MKNLIVYFREPELRHARATRDVKFLQTAIGKLDAIIPAVTNLAQKKDANFADYKLVYKELIKFGSTCAELSTRRTQVRDLHPEVHWPLITGFTPYFDHLIAGKTLIGASELTILANDLVALKDNFLKFITESQQIASESAELQQQYELALEQHVANKKLFDAVFAASNFLNEIPYDISASDFASQYAPEFQAHLRGVSDALIDLDGLEHNLVNKIFYFNIKSVKAAIDLMSEYPQQFVLRNLQKALVQARDETRENLDLDIEKPGKEQGGSARTHKAAPGIELLIKPFACNYYRDLVIDKIKEFNSHVSTSILRSLQEERAALLRLLVIAGEAAKQLIHYNSLPKLNQILEQLVDLRNDIAHGFDEECGRNGLYELIVSNDNSVATFFDKVSQFLTALVSEMGSANSVLDVKPIMQLTTELRAKLRGPSTNSTKQQLDFCHDLPSISHYLLLANNLDFHDVDASTQLASEFYLMAVGTMLKDFETDGNAQIEAAKLAGFTDLITVLIDMRNGLAHELYQLGHLYKSEVIQLLRSVINLKGNFNALDANLTAARAVQQEAATVHLLQESSESAERDFGNLHFRLTSSTATKRRDSESAIRAGLGKLLERTTTLTAASVSLPEAEIRPVILKVVTDTVVKGTSPSKYNVPSPVKALLREHRDKPSAFLLLGFHERIQQLIAIQTNSVSAIAASTSSSAFLTPTKPKLISQMVGEINQSGARAIGRVQTSAVRRIDFATQEQDDSARTIVAAGLSNYGVPLPSTPDAKLKLQLCPKK